MRIILALVLFLPLAAWADRTTITANGNFLSQTCDSGKGRTEVFDGGSGYDSGVVTLQIYSEATLGWENACPTAADCQWSTGDSGAVPFDFGMIAQIRLNVASVNSSADIDAALMCAD